jgi:hypothetical protein
MPLLEKERIAKEYNLPSPLAARGAEFGFDKALRDDPDLLRKVLGDQMQAEAGAQVMAGLKNVGGALRFAGTSLGTTGAKFGTDLNAAVNTATGVDISGRWNAETGRRLASAVAANAPGFVAPQFGAMLPPAGIQPGSMFAPATGSNLFVAEREKEKRLGIYINTVNVQANNAEEFINALEGYNARLGMPLMSAAES